jgi:hypothetical protein
LPDLRIKQTGFFGRNPLKKAMQASAGKLPRPFYPGLQGSNGDSTVGWNLRREWATRLHGYPGLGRKPDAWVEGFLTGSAPASFILLSSHGTCGYQGFRGETSIPKRKYGIANFLLGPVIVPFMKPTRVSRQTDQNPL